MTRKKPTTKRDRCLPRHVVAEPAVVVTFSPPRLNDPNFLAYQRGPSCFNGNVRVVRYCVIIEEIDEPEEIANRLRKLDRSEYGKDRTKDSRC